MVLTEHPMPQVNCAVCRKSFYAKPHWLRKGWGKYCSSSCQHEARKNGRVVTCFICRRKIYRQRRLLKRSKSRKYFCSKPCQLRWWHEIFVGPKHGNWKHGGNVYKNIMLRRDVPRVCKLCAVQNIQALVVHHIDHSRKNNKPGNLCWLCHNCHFLVHHYEREEKRLMVSIA